MNNASDEEIDDSWVSDYKEAESKYNEFYNEPNSHIKVFFMYINTAKTIVNIHQSTLSLNSESTLTKEDLLKIIQAQQIRNNIKYKLFSILRYNIDLQPDEIQDFLQNPGLDATNYCNRFLIPEKDLTDIIFTDTISILQDQNALYIIFIESERHKHILDKHILDKHILDKQILDKQQLMHKFTKKIKHLYKKQRRLTRHKKAI